MRASNQCAPALGTRNSDSSRRRVGTPPCRHNVREADACGRGGIARAGSGVPRRFYRRRELARARVRPLRARDLVRALPASPPIKPPIERAEATHGGAAHSRATRGGATRGGATRGGATRGGATRGGVALRRLDGASKAWTASVRLIARASCVCAHALAWSNGSLRGGSALSASTT